MDTDRVVYSRSMRALAVVLLVGAFGLAGCGQSSSSSSTSTPAKPASAPVNHTNEDQKAQAAVKRAVRVALSDYQTFHHYLITAQMLGNVDPSLKSVPGLTADGEGQNLTISVRSAGGTTFTANGHGTKLNFVCTPAGPDCPGGRWSAHVSAPKVRALTATEKAEVRRILLGSVAHYSAELDQEIRIIGTQPYPDANAGLSAMNDPSSAAARFRDYRQHPNPENDLSFEQAFSKADHYFNAQNEPTAISDWRDDMSQAQGDLSTWINTATSWQISEVPTSKLHAAEAKVRAGLAKARADAIRAAR